MFKRKASKLAVFLTPSIRDQKTFILLFSDVSLLFSLCLFYAYSEFSSFFSPHRSIVFGYELVSCPFNMFGSISLFSFLVPKRPEVFAMILFFLGVICLYVFFGWTELALLAVFLFAHLGIDVEQGR